MAGKAKDDLTALDGGKRPQVRKSDARTWTNAKERAFLEALTESCNVKYAAGVAGIAVSNAYVKKGKDAGFRAGWDRALATGYAQLEMMMLERALHGVEKIVVAKDGTSQVMREYSDRVGLALLRMHRDSAALAEEELPDEEIAEAAERILARLKKIGERGGTVPQGTVPVGVKEVKSALARFELIAWGLRA